LRPDAPTRRIMLAADLSAGADALIEIKSRAAASAAALR